MCIGSLSGFDKAENGGDLIVIIWITLNERRALRSLFEQKYIEVLQTRKTMN